jgi:hypothetical protein
MRLKAGVPRDDHHFFLHFPMDDCHLCYIKEFLKKTVSKHRAKTKLQEKLAQRACTCHNMITIVLNTVSRAVRIFFSAFASFPSQTKSQVV